MVPPYELIFKRGTATEGICKKLKRRYINHNKDPTQIKWHGKTITVPDKEAIRQVNSLLEDTPLRSRDKKYEVEYIV